MRNITKKELKNLERKINSYKQEMRVEMIKMLETEIDFNGDKKNSETTFL